MIHDFDSHIVTVANFWSKSLLHTERYDGHPYTAHTHLPVEPEHFARWLELFTQAVRDNLPKTQAEQALAKATHMAECFKAGLFPFQGLTDARAARRPKRRIPSPLTGASGRRAHFCRRVRRSKRAPIFTTP